jgi:hypothetical protein
MGYPPEQFAALLPALDPVVGAILLDLLGLLAKLTAHAATSGHTPPTLSPLFGPLLFGLGAPGLAFAHTYAAYLRATHGAEHVLLAYVRWQAAGAAGPAGVPARLKDWIRGYPASLPALNVSDGKQTRSGGQRAPPSARKGARTLRVLAVRRNARAYSADLVRTGAGWARIRASEPTNALAGARDWMRVAPDGMAPRYSDGFRRRLDLPPGAQPDLSAAGVSAAPSLAGTLNLNLSLSPALSTAPSAASSLSSASAQTLVDAAEWGEFKSLTDAKWGVFESAGFGGLSGGDRKLQFDLTEGARAVRAVEPYMRLVR